MDIIKNMKKSEEKTSERKYASGRRKIWQHKTEGFVNDKFSSPNKGAGATSPNKGAGTSTAL